MRSLRFSRLAGALVFLASAVVVAACGGGTTSSYPGQPIPTPAAVLSGSITTSTTSSVTLPNVGVPGMIVGGSLPVANAVATITETVSLNAPSGVTPLSKRREAAEPSPSPVAYVTFASTSSVTLSAIPALTFTSSSISSGSYYYLALYTGAGWQGPVSGPGTVTGDSVSFPTSTGSVAITPTQPAILALVATTSQLATPSPTPAPVASPNSLVFDESSPAPQTFTVSEAGYSGTFTASANCTASPVPSPVPTTNPFVAQVSPSSATPTSAGGSVTFTVTPGEETGSCAVTVTDSNLASTAVSVVVGLDQVIIYDRKRH